MTRRAPASRRADPVRDTRTRGQAFDDMPPAPADVDALAAAIEAKRAAAPPEELPGPTFLIVQVDEGEGPKAKHVWHRVERFLDPAEATLAPGIKRPSGDIYDRACALGCGAIALVRGDRLEEVRTEPGGTRHVAKGCFTKQAPAT